jgi:tetratricopeptide (TPR) repeat protein
MCLIVPGAVKDVEAAATLADRAVALGSQHRHLAWFQWAKALAEYRRGRFASAIEWLRKGRDKASSMYLAVYYDLLLAMAQHRLGRAEEALDSLKKARQLMAAQFPRIDGGALPKKCWWHDWLMCHVLRREAEATVGQAAPPPAGQEGDQEKPGKQE